VPKDGLGCLSRGVIFDTASNSGLRTSASLKSIVGCSGDLVSIVSVIFSDSTAKGVNGSRSGSTDGMSSICGDALRGRVVSVVVSVAADVSLRRSVGDEGAAEE